jgi:membrane carboxypeptidase/penicillin-binding protein
MKDRERGQSKRQASRREIKVTREMVIAALDAFRDRRMREGGSNIRWKSQVAKDCGLENYKSLKRKLAEMDISEEWIRSYLSEGE